MATRSFTPTKNLFGKKHYWIQDFTLEDEGIQVAILGERITYSATNFRIEDKKVKFCLYDDQGWIASYIFTDVEDFLKSVKFV